MFIIFMHLLICGLLCAGLLKVRKMLLTQIGNMDYSKEQFFWGMLFSYGYLFIASAKFQVFTNTVSFPEDILYFQNIHLVPFTEWVMALRLHNFYAYVNPNTPLLIDFSYVHIFQQVLKEMFIISPLACIFFIREIKNHHRFMGYIMMILVLNVFVNALNIGTVITLGIVTYILVYGLSLIVKSRLKSKGFKYNQVLLVGSILILLSLTFFTDVLSQQVRGYKNEKIAYNRTFSAADDQIQVKLGTINYYEDVFAKIDLSVKDTFYKLPYDVSRVSYSLIIQTGDLTLPYEIGMSYFSTQSNVESIHIQPYIQQTHEYLPLELPIEVIKVNGVSYTINDADLLNQLQILNQSWQTDQDYPYYEVVYRVPNQLPETIDWWLYLDYEADKHPLYRDWRRERLSELDENGFRYYRVAFYFMDDPEIKDEIEVVVPNATYTIEF